MKKEEIKKAAIKFFLQNGFEGASLSEIAEEAGIKKASIYSHFKGKDDLFLEVLKEAKAEEIERKQQFFEKEDCSNPETFLYHYLLYVKGMFQENEMLKFWLRMGFFPPMHLYDVIQKEVTEAENFQEHLIDEKCAKWIEKGQLTIKDANIFNSAFTGIIIAIMVEIVYFNSGKRVDDKLAALWEVFWKGVSR
ncbi:TetR/AcrR family transcriptional regulator [Niallia sp. Sow4_A1]|uniref:TetR/AcrR family transcriptional regulator n=1 Tax=Bacillaceae TaxID=186817 RepID=UPI0004E10A6E|nr:MULTISPECIES: TetR/AcrR family transcriptional regulator [Bacillaceae]MCF2650822.1 TetR/AcrR family transcriptional regulator [Niallia circulans]MCM3363684.1 TetR/AcrR family transcriptional regulator [Niallia sp. MER TA 168]CAI9395999.1 HTH-type transcriptional regulator BetI [Bacillus sp. T2.9-1]